MKSSLSFGSMLLLSTMLVAPTAAYAQADQPAADTSSVTDEIVVLGRNIPDPQRTTSQVASFLSRDDLARTGDANAALALTRLSGLSVVGGKFAFVRGLGDRYSAARLNGSLLPSPEPLRRTVPLDLFPSSVLEGATVQKTYSPNYAAEFGGGIIDLQTRRDPGDSFLNVKLGVGVNTVATGNNGIFVRGGDLDFLGFDDGLRSIPDPIQAVIDSRTPLTDLDDAQIEVLGESLVNSPLRVIQDGSLGPNFEASVDGGASFDFDNGMTLSLIGVVGYDQEWSVENSIRQVQVGGDVGIDFDTIETNLDATVNGLGSAALEWDNHLIQGTILYIHTSTKQAQIDEGLDFNAPETSIVVDESSSFIERQLGMGQLAGEHTLGEDEAFEVQWRAAFARSTRDSPYEQDLRRIRQEDGSVLFSQANNFNIVFSDLVDDNFSGGLDFSYYVPLSGPREATVTVGAEYSETDRTYNLFAFRFAGGNSLPPDTQAARPDFLFSPDNIDPSRFVLIETSTNTDSYDAELITRAAYLEIDAELIPTVRTTVGFRYEDADQSVITFDRFQNFGPGAQLGNDYFLPSATVTWNFAENMQLRAGYSQTIGRPQFRELAPSLFFDPDTDRSFRGNRFLVDSEFQNFDLRYEYYLGRNQFITLAGFYKEIENPIEEIQFESSTFVFDTTFINSPEAELFGGEFEYRTQFGIPWNDWFDSRDWLFSVNYTYTRSEINADENDVVINPFTGAEQSASLFGLDGAQLQGTPEHIVNAQFGWRDEDDQLTILLGWVDDRILQRGNITSSGGLLPDIVERPGIQLDVNYLQDIVLLNTNFTLGLSARNLLGESNEEFQIGPDGFRTEFLTYERGRSLSASLTARF